MSYLALTQVHRQAFKVSAFLSRLSNTPLFLRVRLTPNPSFHRTCAKGRAGR
jgi:hypothetical protein